MAAGKKAGDPDGPGELSMKEDRRAERWKQLKAARTNVKEAEGPRSRGEIEVEEMDTSFGEDRVTESCGSPRGSYLPLESERQAKQEDRVIRSDYRTRSRGQLRGEGECVDYKVVNRGYTLSRRHRAIP